MKPPARLDNLRVHELKEGAGFIIVHLNDIGVAANVWVFQSSVNVTRQWVEAIRKQTVSQPRDGFTKRSFV